MVVLNQVIIMALLILTGIICYKLNIINKESTKSLSSLVLMVVNPIVILVSYQVEFEAFKRNSLVARTFRCSDCGGNYHFRYTYKK